MFEQFKEWIESLLGSDYQYSLGAWTENESLQFVCAIYGMGGAAVDLDIRRPKFKVLLVGPRDGKQQAAKLLTDIDKLIEASIELSPPCGIAHIRAITEPQGPSFTTENRAWASVDFQLIH